MQECILDPLSQGLSTSSQTKPKTAFGLISNLYLSHIIIDALLT